MGQRAVTVAVSFAALTLLWTAALLHATLAPSMAVPLWFDEITAVFPLWMLVAFGSYSLGSIGWALMTFNECPDAYTSLVKEIKTAKDDLRRKGVTVD